MYKNLQEYIARLEREGELVRISATVDPVLEITEITDRESKKPGGGKALLFENTGTGFPVLTNMMGSERRIAMALGVDNLGELSGRISTLFTSAMKPCPSLWDKLRLLPLLRGVARWMPRNKRGRGECQEVVLMGEEARLSTLPILKCWPHDGGRFVTLPMVNTLDPETGARNVGMYRMQEFSDHSTGMHWHMHKTGARHYEAYKRLGRRMPVSVCLGGDPAYTYAATAPMPEGMDEYMLAGFIRRRGVKLVKCITNDIMVPCDCDIVIEGYVDPAEDKVIEGAFGDHTGFYSLPDLYPVFHVTAITRRREAVYPATIVGVPPQEDAFIAQATEKIFVEPIKMAMLPEVRDMYLPLEGVAHNIAIIDIELSYPGQAFKAASALWGAGQMMFNKFMVVTSCGGDIRDPETLAKLLRGVDLRRDLLWGRGPMDVLDHSSLELGYGGKLAVDATDRSEEDTAPLAPIDPRGLRVDSSLMDKWRAAAIYSSTVTMEEAECLATKNAGAGVKYLLIFDDSAEGLRGGDLVWLGAANCDPELDCRLAGDTLIMDCRVKTEATGRKARPWPNVVTMDKATITKVDSRWNEYGIGPFTKSPSQEYARLVRGDSAEITE